MQARCACQQLPKSCMLVVQFLLEELLLAMIKQDKQSVSDMTERCWAHVRLISSALHAYHKPPQKTIGRQAGAQAHHQ